jgi:hypothetical protein
MKGIISLCALVIALAGCGSGSEEVKEEPQAQSQTNSKYVKMVAKGLKKNKLVEEISEMLYRADHVNPEFYNGEFETMDTPTTHELMKFKKKALIKVYYLLHALDDSDFKQKIGEELEIDRYDTSSEYGGILHLLENGDVGIQMLPSDPSKCSLDARSWFSSLADYFYCLPDVGYVVDRLAVFHFHSNRQSTALSSSDVGVLFTRIDENTFNVGYSLHSEGKNYNLDLGVYRY